MKKRAVADTLAAIRRAALATLAQDSRNRATPSKINLNQVVPGVYNEEILKEVPNPRVPQGWMKKLFFRGPDTYQQNVQKGKDSPFEHTRKAFRRMLKIRGDAKYNRTPKPIQPALRGAVQGASRKGRIVRPVRSLS